jgi:hypothetical protein
MTVNHLYPTTRPTLDLNFARQKRLDPRVTFTRGSTATYVGSDGLIKTAASNTARFDHDPVTGESLGLLVEESRTNSWTYSEQPSQSPWTQTNITVTENNVTSPDGNSTGALLSSSSSGSSYVYQTHNENIPTFTIYAKAGTTNNLWVRLQSNVVSRNVAYNFNLSDGTFSAATGNTGNLSGWTERKSITNAGNGWYRIEVGFTSTTNSVTTDYQISPSTDGNAGASGETVYIWGAQLEKDRTFPTSYIPTTSSTVTRSADLASMTGTNFSSWYNQDEGTLLQSFVPKGSNVTYAGRLYLNSTNYTGPYINPITRIVHMYRTSTAENVLLKTGTYVNTAVNLGMSYDTASFSGCYNGTTVQTASSITGTQSTLTQLLVGLGTQHIARLTYYPTRLTDSQLQELTR